MARILFIMKNSILFIICNFFSLNCLFAQSFYGVNGLGQMELINDSLYCVSFYAYGILDFCDTGTYYKKDDTIYLNSATKQNFEFITEEKKVTNRNLNLFSEYTVKIYRKDKEDEYRFIYETIIPLCHYDSIKKELFASVSVCNGDIVVVESFSPYKYRRFMVATPQKYKSYKLRFRISDDKIDRVYFNNFPLLKAENKLVPINDDKNFHCWVDNGFFFPTMELKTKKEKRNGRILLSERGVQGLVNKIMIDK